MRKLFCFVLAAIMFVACGKDDFGLNSQPEPQNPYAVTPEEAVQMLQSVIGGETTRSISVSDIQTLNQSAFVPSTRSGADEEAIYIVDIEGKGSAIVSADKRMEPIYAILDDTKISAEQLVGVTTRSATDDESNPEDYILGLLNSAIQRDIEEAEQRGIEMPLIPRDQIWFETTDIAYQPQMMNTAWHQDDPFNRRYGYVSGTTQRYKAGCGPVALAQILYCNRYPNSINGVIFDWDLLAQYEEDYMNASYAATNEIANFVYQIKLRANAMPTGNGPAMGLYPAEAAAFMRNTGYPDATLVNYSISNVIDMVYNKHLPVYVAGEHIASNGTRTGHAWVIDGCNVYRVDEWCRHYLDSSIFTETIVNTQTYNLVHCNFGWGRSADPTEKWIGFYTSAIFNPIVDSIQYNYSSNLQMVTYSLNN